MHPKFFIGIDISQLTIDAAVVAGNVMISQHKVENKETPIKDLIQQLKMDHGCTAANSFYCAEQMGIYETFLSKVCFKKKLKICFESPLQIKRSMGIQRGKNDKVDALRIAQYASKNFRTLRLWRPPSPIFEHLKRLSSLRKRLLKLKIIVGGTRKVESYYLKRSEQVHAASYLRSSTVAIEDDLKKIDQEITTVIDNDSHLKGLLKLVSSVPGIGKVIGSQLIIYTNGFDKDWTAKKFASYCGVAPFEWSSGTSVKGRTKVSSLANKDIKANLHLATMSIIHSKGTFICNYYNRRVKEGKNKMSVLNAIKNKLIHRVFACVRNNHSFTEIKIG